MIETATPIGVNQELPVPDPEFRIEPQQQANLVMPSGLAVFRRDDRSEVGWVPTTEPLMTEEASNTLDKMVASCEREARRHPESVRALINLGVALMNAGRLDTAVVQFEKARSLDASDVSVASHLSRVFLLQHRIDDAASCAAEVRRLDPRNVLGMLLQAAAALLAGNLSLAEAALKEATVIDGNNPAPQYLLGVLYLGNNRARDAVGFLRAAARLAPRRAITQHALGIAHSLLGDWSKATRAFRTALSVAPHRRESVLALARALLHQEEIEKAIGSLSTWLASSPSDREAHELIAQAYRDVQNSRAAKRHLVIALEALNSSGVGNASDRSRLMNNIGVCFAMMGQHTEAADWYSRSIRESPTGIALLNLARAYHLLGKLETARVVLESVLSQESNNRDAQFLKSVIANKLGDHEEALGGLKALLSTGQAPAEAYAYLGSLLADEERDFVEARKILLEAHGRFPGVPGIANNLAYAQLMLGDVAGAREVIASVAPQEGRVSVYLTATTGLLRLYEGDFHAAAELYRQAERIARENGNRKLARTVRQKMCLEFSRAFRRAGEHQNALEFARRGLTLEGRESYRRDLRAIKSELTGDGRLLESGDEPQPEE